MLETQQINRAIAEALTAQGFDAELAFDTHNAWCPEERCWVGTRKPIQVNQVCGTTVFQSDCQGVLQLKPHDFTDPRYLFPALEEYAKRFVIFRIDTYRARHDGIWNGFLGVDYGNSDGDGKGRETYPARGASYCEALRNAFAAALGVNI